MSYRAFTAALLLMCASCGVERGDMGDDDAAALTRGDPERGHELIDYYGCGGCHTIPGVRAADGTVGPSLKGLAGRMYVAGTLPNEPANLTRWIENPQAINPKSAMPNMGVSPADARDIAAYLYSAH